jgi:hypothetical protein
VIALLPTPPVDLPPIFSVTVVLGLLFACPFVTNLPEIALLDLVAFAILIFLFK